MHYYSIAVLQYCTIAPSLSQSPTLCSHSVFALYDGHGGNGVSTVLVNQLHLVIHNKLELVLPQIMEAWNMAKEADPKVHWLSY